LLYHTKNYGPNIGKREQQPETKPKDMLRKKRRRRRNKMGKESLEANEGGGSWFEVQEEQSCRF
jgi:hypothetical protein